MSAFLWELVKGHNAFLSKNVNGTIWSKEKGNLFNKNSYKYSGLANLSNTVDVAEKDGAVAISTSSKKSGRLATSLVKKNSRRTNHAVAAVAGSVRPDLKAAARARASAISRGLRHRKATAQ